LGHRASNPSLGGSYSYHRNVFSNTEVLWIVMFQSFIYKAIFSCPSTSWKMEKIELKVLILKSSVWFLWLGALILKWSKDSTLNHFISINSRMLIRGSFWVTKDTSTAQETPRIWRELRARELGQKLSSRASLRVNLLFIECLYSLLGRKSHEIQAMPSYTS
jgi:hypothetical protein